MALNVAWRWAMPQVGSPNAQADAMAAGVQGLAQGIGQMISNANKEKWREQNQANLDRDYALRQKQFDQSKELQDFNMQRQKDMMEYIKSRYGKLLGIGDYDPARKEYEKLLAELNDQQGKQARMLMMGLNPQLMR